MTALTPEGRAELRRLLDEAAPGPWETFSDNVSGHGTEHFVWSPSVANEDDTGILAVQDQDADGGVVSTGMYGRADAALIVALRNNAEALLDTADSLPEIVSERDRLTETLRQAETFGIGEFRATEWAYGQATKTIEKHRQRADQAEAENVRLTAEVDRLGRELTARGLAHVLARGGDR